MAWQEGRIPTLVVGVKIPHNEDRPWKGGEVVLILRLGGSSGRIVAHHHSEPG